MAVFSRSLLASLILLASPVVGGEPEIVEVASPSLEPWESRWFEVETGYLWKVRNNSPLNYETVPTQFTIRGKSKWGRSFADGSDLVLRDRFTLLGSYFASGPETYYLGVSLGPVLEWHPAHDRWSVYLGAGGGVGLTDSTGGERGGMGQDFTLNWYASLGLRYHLTEECHLFAGPFFIHHSNGGMTDPNPGIDNLGFTIGVSKRF